MNIKFCSLSSGSSGNCQYIETGNTKILVDGGFSGKKIEGLLNSIDVCPKELDGIFVTHEHSDHVRGVGVLSRRYNIPIYANEKTWIGMEKSIGKISDENTKIFISERDLNIKDLGIHPIRISHDAGEPVGYIIYYKDKKISIVTDTGWVSEGNKEKIKGSNLYLMESNHDVDMLWEGSYPLFLKERVLGRRGHLSNEDAGRVLGDVITGTGEIVLLGHLSGENNKPELAHRAVSKAIGNRGVDVEKDITLDLTYRDRVTKVYNL